MHAPKDQSGSVYRSKLNIWKTSATNPTKNVWGRQCRMWVIFDRVIELSLRVDVRFDPESDHDRAALQYLAKGQKVPCRR